jgi:2-dehydropantoate 2-reductase
VRFVVYGAGAVGGVVGARLHQSGADVVLIARGAHHDLIARDGLTLLTPDERTTMPIPVAHDPRTAGVSDDDVVLMAMKSQDTAEALAALREVAPGATVVMAQNGVDNERTALRVFADVYGALVLVPAAHLEPGVVLSYTTEISGHLDVGVYPNGSDARCEQICAALRAATFESSARENIMVHKYDKLLRNLNNAVQAVCGLEDDTDTTGLRERLQHEGRGVLDAAGIEYGPVEGQGRISRWGRKEVPGYGRGGGSTWQSATRGTPVETDFLNGEIVLQARLLGMPAPLNELMQQLAHETVAGHHRPGWKTAAEVLALAETASTAHGQRAAG